MHKSEGNLKWLTEKTKHLSIVNYGKINCVLLSQHSKNKHHCKIYISKVVKANYYQYFPSQQGAQSVLQPEPLSKISQKDNRHHSQNHKTLKSEMRHQKVLTFGAIFGENANSFNFRS